MAKEGSTIAGLMECFGTVVSVSLQHGVPLRVLCDKLSHTRFEPSGWTGNERIGYAKSIMDYIFRWIEARFLARDQLSLFKIPVDGTLNEKSDIASRATPPNGFEETYVPGDAPPCVTCGALMVPNGSCFKCVNCGGTSGCS
jgi:ribonucleoside-diphosphate reductase alpha chain